MTIFSLLQNNLWQSQNIYKILFQEYEYEYEEDPNAIEGLPASAAALLDAPYDDGFNCDQQDAGYGYYADTLNNCQVH